MSEVNEIIDEYLLNRYSYKDYHEQITRLFFKAIENTQIPEKTWFGFPKSKNALSLMYGRIFLLGIFNHTIEIIVDSDISKEVNLPTRIVGTSKSNNLNLFWINTSLENINLVINNEKIWEHYRIASILVSESNNIKAERKDWLEGKKLLSEINIFKKYIISDKLLEETFQSQIQKSLSDKREKRLQRLKIAKTKPLQVETKTKMYLRNSDVVAETLIRANGFCEYCGKKAPFIKDTDGIGFLEVHHIIPLSENGDDIIENAVALCPNCHKHAHYGKKTFEIEKLKNINLSKF